MLATAFAPKASIETARILRDEAISLIKQYVVTYQQLNQITSASFTNQAKSLSTKTLLLLRKDPSLEEAIEETHEKQLILDEESLLLTKTVNEIKSRLNDCLDKLTRMANEISEKQDLPYRIPNIHFPKDCDATLASVKHDIEEHTLDLLKDLQTAEDEIIKTAAQFTVADITKDELEKYGIANSLRYDELLNIIMPNPSRQEDGHTGGKKHPAHMQITNIILSAIKWFSTRPEFKYRLIANIYHAHIAIRQAQGIEINVTTEREEISKAEMTHELSPVASDYCETLLNTFFANCILVRRQERKCTELAQIHLNLHGAEEKYWTNITKLSYGLIKSGISNIFSSDNEEEIEKACYYINKASRHVILSGRELKDCQSICHSTPNHLRAHQEVMKKHLDEIMAMRKSEASEDPTTSPLR